MRANVADARTLAIDSARRLRINRWQENGRGEFGDAEPGATPHRAAQAAEKTERSSLRPSRSPTTTRPIVEGAKNILANSTTWSLVTRSISRAVSSGVISRPK